MPDQASFWSLNSSGLFTGAQHNALYALRKMHNDADQTVHGGGRVYDGIDLFLARKRDFAGRPAACN